MLVKIDDIQIGPRHRNSTGDIEGLARSINDVGLLEPIVINANYRLIAGKRRIEACRMLGMDAIEATVVDLDELSAELAEIDENLARHNLTVLEEAEHLARRKEIYEEMHPETKQGRAGAEARWNATDTMSFASETAKAADISQRTIQRGVQIATSIPQDVRDTLRDTDVADRKVDLLTLARMEPDEQRRVADVIASGEADTVMDARRLTNREHMKAQAVPDGEYTVLYADPPWQYGNSGSIGTDNYGHAERHYPTISIADLCALPVRDMAADNAVLFLWVTSPLLEECFPVIRAWGFQYKTSFVWDKVRHNFGYYNSVRHELLLVCTRGSCLPEIDTKADSVVSIERTDKHSEKPAYFRELIEQLYPSASKIELFAREQHPGWATWGNEA